MSGWRRIGAVLCTGALLSVGSAVLASMPAQAVTTVSTEAQLRDAFGNAEETSISLSSDITLTDCESSDIDRSSDTSINVEGNGHTITQTCPNSRIFFNSGQGAITVDDIGLTGGDLTDSGGGAIFNDGLVTVTNSSLYGNSGDEGGAVFSFNSIVVKNSTVTGNTATSSGGGLAAPEVTIVYATVAGNTAPKGSNIEIRSVDTINAFASVVGQPLGGGENCHFEQSVSTDSSGYNYSDDASCGFTNTATGDHETVADLGLGAATDAARPTMTPADGSPLIDAVPTAACQDDGATGITTDELGATRPSGNGCDTGAIEVVATAVTTTTEAPTTTVATPVAVQPQFTG